MDLETLRMVREEVTRIQLENRNRETSLGKERKTIMGEEEKIDFFPQWQPPQGVVEETEEGEQYMTTGEDGRPYIAVRMRQEDKKENKVHKERKEQRVIVENKEEEQYMTVDEDGRPYIAVRKEETRGQTRKGRTRVENRYRKRESRAADWRRN